MTLPSITREAIPSCSVFNGATQGSMRSSKYDLEGRSGDTVHSTAGLDWKLIQKNTRDLDANPLRRVKVRVVQDPETSQESRSRNPTPSSPGLDQAGRHRPGSDTLTSTQERYDITHYLHTISIPEIVLAILLIVAALIVLDEGFTPCSMNGFLQGKWGVYTSMDDVNYELSHNITITSDILFNYGLTEFPTLMFFCYNYDGSKRYIAFGSPETEMFKQYTVRIYFCWYLFRIDSYNYYVMEGTRAIHVNSDQHAKAYLVNGTLSPSQSTVCEMPHLREPSPPYKQLRKVITLNWGDTK
ncbi:hypothetical protein RRG08_052553 [Elysia crispata]|uniref:Uncharacterized protein n=1 Tax=Elysia crispata TaxID=231223 RepID=A0AAE0Z5P4_9GAST|nr:hypothetical protein RRG08_052553 [Elysia crispata]